MCVRHNTRFGLDPNMHEMRSRGSSQDIRDRSPDYGTVGRKQRFVFPQCVVIASILHTFALSHVSHAVYSYCTYTHNMREISRTLEICLNSSFAQMFQIIQQCIVD